MLKVIYSHAGSDPEFYSGYAELWYGRGGKIWKFFQIVSPDLPCYEPATRKDVQEIISWTGLTEAELATMI